MFRARLKEHSRPGHERLENLSRMVGYASGNVPPETYRSTVRILYDFWSQALPVGLKFPPVYSNLLSVYREALRGDSGPTALPVTSEQTPYDSVAFYYVLLGSSHGARFMLKNVASSAALPVRHLRVLADQAHALWTPFVSDYLQQVEPERETVVMDSAKRMFEDLYSRMND